MDRGNRGSPGSYPGSTRNIYGGTVLDGRLWRDDGTGNDGWFWFLEPTRIYWNGTDVVDPNRLASFIGAWRGGID